MDVERAGVDELLKKLHTPYEYVSYESTQWRSVEGPARHKRSMHTQVSDSSLGPRVWKYVPIRWKV